MHTNDTTYQVMPIARGEGIDQRMLVHLQRRLGAGGWAHVFPEGRCYQTGIQQLLLKQLAKHK
jgi:hypothetical protein